VLSSLQSDFSIFLENPRESADVVYFTYFPETMTTLPVSIYSRLVGVLVNN